MIIWTVLSIVEESLTMPWGCTEEGSLEVWTPIAARLCPRIRDKINNCTKS